MGLAQSSASGLTVYPAGEGGKFMPVEHAEMTRASLEASITMLETALASGTACVPPSLLELDPDKDCRIGRAEFDAICKFERANPQHYENAVSLKREFPAPPPNAAGEDEKELSASAGAPDPPTLLKGEDGNWYEPGPVYTRLAVAQLLAHWYAAQKGMDAGQVPFPTNELRFAEGDRVECQVAPGVFAAGVVLKAGRCGYIEFGASKPSPYRVKLDDSELSELIQHKFFPEGHNGLIHVPIDVAGCVREAPPL